MAVYNSLGRLIKWACVALVCFSLPVLLAGCTAETADPTENVTPEAEDGGQFYGVSDDGQFHVAVLYLDEGDGADHQGWQDTYSHYQQSLLANLQVTAINLHDGGDPDLTPYDLVYPDPGILPAGDRVSEAIMAYVESGGAVFLENDFHDFFPEEFLGVSEFVPLEGLPQALTYPDVGADLSTLQEIVEDFSALYAGYTDREYFAGLDYGYAARLDGATALVEQDGLALYFVHQAGEGTVFFTNPLLPNVFSINGFSLEQTDEAQTYFINTTASANQLLRNAFAAYVSKQSYGYAVERVFGAYTAPAIAWELYYEEINGIGAGDGVEFAELCREYGQIPSFSLARAPMSWYVRAESITYALGREGDEPLTYALDAYENIYSSGTHVVSEGGWLSINSQGETPSYFDRVTTYDLAATPYVADFTGDGNPDILSGSSDGQFYLYAGEAFDGRFTVSGPQLLTDPDGEVLTVPGYSAPARLDVDGDGVLDLVSGAGDGSLYWFRATGDPLTYEVMGVLLDTGFGPVQTFPAVGDLNGDGTPDLVIGSDTGSLEIRYGEGRAPDLTFTTGEDLSDLSEELGLWLAPTLADLDDDGLSEIVLGTADGYIVRLARNGSDSFVPDYFEGDELNYEGNSRLKFVGYAVPCFADLDGDGVLDLIVGQIEYGLAYPIDSEYFPYTEELAEQIAYFEEYDIFLQMHLYTHEYASPEQEAAEIAYHIEAMNAYGVDVTGLGTNQHTWHISKNSPTQSYLVQYEAGILWNSGAKAAGASAQVSAETVLSMPYYLMADGEPTMLIINTPTFPRLDDSRSVLCAKYGMPIYIYYHCDSSYLTGEDHVEAVAQVAEFVEAFDYSFVSEDQLAKAAAAAYNTAVTVEAAETGLTLSGTAVREDLGLYDEAYQDAVGVKITFAEAFSETVTTDADVWRWDGDALYIGLNRDVTLYFGDGDSQAPHLTRINLPARITATDTGAEIAFEAGGMMQVQVEGLAETDDPDWIVRQSGGYTLFTRYGKAATLELTYTD